MAAEITLKDLKGIVVRRRNTIIITSMISLIIFYTIIYFSKPEPVYESVAAIKIEEKPSIMELLALGQRGYRRDINTAASMIRSFEVLFAIAKKFGLIPSNVKKKDALNIPKYMAVIKDLESRITTEQEKGGGNILLIKVRWSDPVTSKNIANAIAEKYIEIDFYEKNKSIITSKQTIEKKLKQALVDLMKKREKLRNYRMRLELADITSNQKVLITNFVDKRKRIEELNKNNITIDDKISILRDNLKKGKLTGWIHTGVGAVANVLFQLNSQLNALRLKESNLLIHFNPEHPEIKAIREQMKAVLDQMIRELESQKLQNLKEIELLRKDLILTKERLKGIPDQIMEFSTLERDVKNAEELYSKLAGKYQEASIRESELVGDVTMVRYAVKGRQINTVTITMNIILSSFLAILFGFVGGFVHEAIDTVPHKPEEISDIFGIPLLTNITIWKDVPDNLKKIKSRYPGISEENRRRYLSLATHFLPDSLTAEQYRAVIPNILDHSDSLEEKLKVLTILSPLNEEGTSVFAANLAISISQTGRTVVLVDTDFRNPAIHELFGINNEPGLRDILLGNYEWDTGIRKITDLMLGEMEPEHLMATPGLDNLFIITSGCVVENPSQYLNSSRMDETLSNLSDIFDYIILDTPPAMMYSESFITTGRADAAILLTEFERLPRKTLQSFRAQLINLKIPLLGLVVNKVRREAIGS
jgi:capsular exopolysaccharide synthesis family protein